ncbi:hypothetical protein GCM10023149_28720 [Mucilaginibacter gynuensis]|uniref:Uncharacterized protein n=1 Tax=Mucilaginibacter gynuensis TaxID=1302236 RepID=A0ABP8GKP0_9SPHI
MAFLSLVIFVYSTFDIFNRFSEPTFSFTGSVYGFEDNGKTDESDDLANLFKAKIKTATETAKQDQQTYFLVSLLVTALTAASTLVATIQAAKSGSALGKAQPSVIIIGVLTFCSTIASAVSTRLNEVKTEDAKKVTEIITLRDAFFTDYDKASDAQKHNVVVTYKRKLEI